MYATIVATMSKSIRKYQVKDKRNQYKQVQKRELEDKYYTDVSKSHDRKIRKKGRLPEELDDFEQ